MYRVLPGCLGLVLLRARGVVIDALRRSARVPRSLLVLPRPSSAVRVLSWAFDASRLRSVCIQFLFALFG